MDGGRDVAPHQAGSSAGSTRVGTPVGEVGGRRSGFSGGLTMDDGSATRANGSGQQQQQPSRPLVAGGEDPDRETMA